MLDAVHRHNHHHLSARERFWLSRASLGPLSLHVLQPALGLPRHKSLPPRDRRRQRRWPRTELRAVDLVRVVGLARGGLPAGGRQVADVVGVEGEAVDDVDRFDVWQRRACPSRGRVLARRLHVGTEHGDGHEHQRGALDAVFYHHPVAVELVVRDVARSHEVDLQLVLPDFVLGVLAHQPELLLRDHRALGPLDPCGIACARASPTPQEVRSAILDAFLRRRHRRNRGPAATRREGQRMRRHGPRLARPRRLAPRVEKGGVPPGRQPHLVLRVGHASPRQSPSRLAGQVRGADVLCLRERPRAAGLIPGYVPAGMSLRGSVAGSRLSDSVSQAGCLAAHGYRAPAILWNP
mmetsp:Transcript_1918/g.4484  ORF Transcript_1918/g.4484 Transcript_1918/m.4484 type:complete len:351 (-) Transcript_1918:194-1246(-)